MAETTENLRHATSMALYHGGLHVLREPRRFVALVSDELGASASEVRVLYHTVDMGYIERFADAADAGTPSAFRDATERAAAQLEDEFDMRRQTARDISLAISLGTWDFLGMEEPIMPSGWESDEDRKRKAADAERRKAEEEQRKAEEAERRRKSEEAERQRRAEEERRRKSEEAERQRQAAAAAAAASNAATQATSQGASGTGSSATDAKGASGSRGTKVIVAIVAIVVCIILGRVIASQVIVPGLKDSKSSGSSTQQVTSSTSSDSTSKSEGEKSTKDQKESGSEAKTETKTETKKEDSSSTSSTSESSETKTKRSDFSILSDPDTQWWGGKTDTGAIVCYMENETMQEAMFFFSSGSRVGWCNGPFENDGSTVTINYVTRNGGQESYSFSMLSQSDDYITIETDDYGSATLPAMSEDQQATVRESIININNA